MTLRYVKSVCQSWLGAVVLSLNSSAALITSRRVQGQDYRTQPALADRLHLSEGDWLGLVLSVDNPRRLLALHHRLEALYDDEGRGCRGYLATGAHRLRLRPGTGDSQAAPAQRQRLQLCLWRSRRMARRTRHRTRARRTQSSAN